MFSEVYLDNYIVLFQVKTLLEWIRNYNFPLIIHQIEKLPID
jgi:hypothetical protein